MKLTAQLRRVRLLPRQHLPPATPERTRDNALRAPVDLEVDIAELSTVKGIIRCRIYGNMMSLGTRGNLVHAAAHVIVSGDPPVRFDNHFMFLRRQVFTDLLAGLREFLRLVQVLRGSNYKDLHVRPSHGNLPRIPVSLYRITVGLRERAFIPELLPRLCQSIDRRYREA